MQPQQSFVASALIGIGMLGLCFSHPAGATEPLQEELPVTHHYAQNGAIKIHYASLGEGPLMVMIHGFPDYWYTWRHQMKRLSSDYRVVAVDQRGYNRSDQPKGVEAYRIQHLVADIRAVIADCHVEKAIVVGHDWGGFVAWNVAMHHPEITDKLIVLNLPHPAALSRELAHNPKQRANSQYARNFQKADAHQRLSADSLARWVGDESARNRYLEAFRRSDFEAMLNYYKANYPNPPYQASTGEIIKVKCPVLMFHGLDDWALLPGGLNGTWDYLDNELTLVTLPRTGHFVQQDQAERVTFGIESWLQLQNRKEAWTLDPQ